MRRSVLVSLGWRAAAPLVEFAQVAVAGQVEPICCCRLRPAGVSVWSLVRPKQVTAVELGKSVRMDRWVRWMDFERAALVFLQRLAVPAPAAWAVDHALVHLLRVFG